MARPASLRITIALTLTAIAVPATALASSGGSGLTSQTTPTTGQPKAAAVVPTGTVSGDGITLSGRSVALLRGTEWLTGTLSSSQAGHTVAIQLQSAGGWTTVTTATTGTGGSFAAAWHPTAAGQQTVRAATATGQATPALAVTVAKSSIATMYGPGFYGHHTACGAVLRKRTIGVANRKLPCGTPVSIYYRGRTIVVPVIDRGPYANNANWDLTMATGHALGMTGTSTIGAVSARAAQ